MAAEEIISKYNLKEGTIPYLFLNDRSGEFRKAYRQYPAYAAMDLKKLAREDPYGYASGEVKKFADSMPSYKSLGSKIGAYKWVRTGGWGAALALTFLTQSYVALLLGLAGAAVLQKYANGKISKCAPDYLFKREFEKDDK